MKQAIISERTPYSPERIWQARRAFFDEGNAPVGLIDDPVLRSWQRCRGLGRGATDQVEFDPVDRAALARLLEVQRMLLYAALPELDMLARPVSDAGYAVLLTDAKGRALAVEGCTDRHCEPLRQAFRPGVDLSETVIGTNALSLAISEQRLVRVLGPEHFFADNQIFHCCAVPVFDPQGSLVGAVNISRDMPGMVAGAQALTQRCAQRIERKLFEVIPAFLRLRLEAQDESEDAWLAFNRDGGLLSANNAARYLIEVPVVPQGLDSPCSQILPPPFIAGQAQNHPLLLPQHRRIHRKFKQRCRVFWQYQSGNKHQHSHHGGGKKDADLKGVGVLCR